MDKNFSGWGVDETAHWLTFMATRRARHLFGGREAEGIKLVTQYGKLAILFEEKLVISVKKLTKRSKRRGGPERVVRSNNLTRRNRDYWDQRRKNDEPDVPRVILGYMLLKEITDIKVLLAYPRSQERGVEWLFPVPAQPLAPQAFTPRLVTGAEEQSEKGFTIGPARKNQDKDTGTE